MAKKIKKIKKKLTTEEKIERYKKRKRMSLTVKLIIAAAVIVLLIPLSYFGYYYAVFDAMLMPTSSSDNYKVRGTGYTHPLYAVSMKKDARYILAYYSDGKWHVVDDVEVLRENRDSFVIYTDKEVITEKSLRRLCIYEDYTRIVFNSLESLTLIDNRSLKGKEKLMTTEEFKSYAKQKNIFVDDIGD